MERRWWFALFFVSGFSGLLYQIVWLRLAFAAFGVIAPVMSVVLSVFMLGLGLGSWLAGGLMGRLRLSPSYALRAYACAEALIGLGGVLVPHLFRKGETLLLPTGDSDSATYLICSAGIIAVSLLPFCIAMGMTYPLMMQAIRSEPHGSRNFSFLYLANVIGAMCGAALTPIVLVELLGFHRTLWVGACGNWLAAIVSFRLSGRLFENRIVAEDASATDAAEIPKSGSTFRLWVLFTTGLASMAVEVVWTRAFTPVLKTQVYSFSGLLFTYLLATWCGSLCYRRHVARHATLSTAALTSALALAAFAQLLLADPRIQWPRYWLQSGWVLLTIVPYCGILGYLTPKLIDEHSAGNPRSAGRAYAVNIFGCILGPLFGSYVLLSTIGVEWSGIVLALPLLVLAGISLWRPLSDSDTDSDVRRKRWPGILWLAAGTCGLIALAFGTGYEDQYVAAGGVIRRDHTATVIAYEEQGIKQLLVNGTPITVATPNTKLMAHLPLCHFQAPAQSALVICFGMGTTFRSLLSWDIETTAVELVPSVRDSFGYFFSDTDEVRRNPLGTIIVDDGRRYLRRTTKQFDVITIDPPPPVEAAGSSLLYSTDFYRVLEPRLSDGGILQQWYPGGDLTTLIAVIQSLNEVFPHIRMLGAFDGWGVHVLASLEPIPDRSVEDLVARLPEKARRDLLEWTPTKTPADFFAAILARKADAAVLIDDTADVRITDDRPFNEYFILRYLWENWTHTYSIVH